MDKLVLSNHGFYNHDFEVFIDFNKETKLTVAYQGNPYLEYVAKYVFNSHKELAQHLVHQHLINLTKPVIVDEEADVEYENFISALKRAYSIVTDYSYDTGENKEVINYVNVLRSSVRYNEYPNLDIEVAVYLTPYWLQGGVKQRTLKMVSITIDRFPLGRVLAKKTNEVIVHLNEENDVTDKTHLKAYIAEHLSLKTDHWVI